MTNRHVRIGNGFSGDNATARAIFAFILAISLVGAQPAMTKTPELPAVDAEQLKTKRPDDGKTKPSGDTKARVTDGSGDSKAKGSDEGKAKASNDSKAKGSDEGKAKASNDSKSKGSDEGKAKVSNDSKSKSSDEGKAKVSNDSKSKSADEGKAKASSESKAKGTDEGKAKASSESKSKSADEGKAKASSESKSKGTDEGKAKASKSKGADEVTAQAVDESKPDGKSNNSDDSDKPKRGLFGRKKDKSKGKDETERKAEEKESSDADKAQAEADAASETTKPVPVDAKPPAAPGKAAADVQKAPEMDDEEEAIAPLLPDAGLISILKDISRGLVDSEEIAKIEDPCQKTALSVGAAALAKAVGNPDLISNRIITAQEKERFKSSMTVESWASGDIQVSPQCHASLSAVWAKKLDGLVNVAIAGNCNCKNSPDKVGEFVLVLNARSMVDTGFDIQSQADVNFWLGKLSSVGVDTICCGADKAQAGGGAGQSLSGLTQRSQRSLLVLQSVMTERSRKYQAAQDAFNERRRQLAMKAEEERLQKEEEAKAKAEAEAKAKAEAEDKAKAEAEAKAKTEAEAKAKTEAEAKAKTEAEAKAKTDAESNSKDKVEKPEKVAKSDESDKAKVNAQSETEGASEPVSGLPEPGQARVTRRGTVVEDPRTGQTKTVVVPERPRYGLGSADEGGSANLAMTGSAADQFGPRPAAQGGWDSPAPPPAANLPSAAAQIVVPQRAIAGQFLTSAVLNARHAGESAIELSFNGATLATGQDGKALYMVPEDALPGPTLHVSMVARPESPPIPIQILQPLATPLGQQIPRIDRVSVLVPGGGAITIDGHHFDGVANRNSVIIDGMWDARVLVSSPVELKADLPSNLAAGAHAVSVNTGGLRSNPGQFEVVIPEAQPLIRETAKESVRKLVVRANGTKVPVRLRLRNLTPEILRVNKGNDLSILTPGGINNSVLIDVQRLRPGAFRVEATME